MTWDPGHRAAIAAAVEMEAAAVKLQVVALTLGVGASRRLFQMARDRHARGELTSYTAGLQSVYDDVAAGRIQ